MKIDEIKTIVKLVADNDLTEFKLESDGVTLSISRGATAMAAPAVVHVAAPVAAPAPVAAAPAPVAAAPAPATAAPVKTINAPLVGTFYRASSPDAPAFAKIGDKVTAESPVCIIEAMKVMNEIKAEATGVIKEILVENGQPVEYGQPLFVIE